MKFEIPFIVASKMLDTKLEKKFQIPRINLIKGTKSAPLLREIKKT